MIQPAKVGTAKPYCDPTMPSRWVVSTRDVCSVAFPVQVGCGISTNSPANFHRLLQSLVTLRPDTITLPYAPSDCGRR